MDKKQFEKEIKYEYVFLFYKRFYKEGIISSFDFCKAERAIREKYRPIISQVNLYST